MPDDLFETLRAAGEHDSDGAFTVDRARMRAKMQRYRFTDPGMWAVLLVNAAVAAHAAVIQFGLAERYARAEVTFDGTPTDLRRLAWALQDETPQDASTAALAAALAQLVESRGCCVEVRQGNDRMLVYRDEETKQLSYGDFLREPLGNRTRLTIFSSALTPHELESVRHSCAFAPLSILGFETHGRPSHVVEGDFLVARRLEASTPSPFRIDLRPLPMLWREHGRLHLLLAYGGPSIQVAVVNGQSFDISSHLRLPGILCVLGDDTLTPDLSHGALVEDDTLRAHVAYARQQARHMAEQVAESYSTIPLERLRDLESLLALFGLKNEGIHDGSVEHARRELLLAARKKVAASRGSDFPGALEKVVEEARTMSAGPFPSACDELCRQWTAQVLRSAHLLSTQALRQALSAAFEARRCLPTPTVDEAAFNLRLALLAHGTGLDADAAVHASKAAEAAPVEATEVASLIERARGFHDLPPVHPASSPNWRRIVEADLAFAKGGLETVADTPLTHPPLALIDTVVDALRLLGRSDDARTLAGQALEAAPRDAIGDAERAELLDTLRTNHTPFGNLAAWLHRRLHRAAAHRAAEATQRDLMREDDTRASEYHDAARRLEDLLPRLEDDAHVIDEARALQLRLTAIGCAHLAIYEDVSWLLVRALRHARRFEEADRAVARLHLASRLRNNLLHDDA